MYDVLNGTCTHCKYDLDLFGPYSMNTVATLESMSHLTYSQYHVREHGIIARVYSILLTYM
jgi:uncharacterized protein YwgA